MKTIKNAFSLYVKDLNTLRTNWAAAVILAGLIFLPPLYAWFNIDASIDPYANTGLLNIGIVSYDKGAQLADDHFNAGNEVMEKLRTNDSLNWVFFKTNDEAVEAVRLGHAYAAIVMPDDFSESLISVLTHNPKRAVISYYENDKINAISPKIMQKGAETLQEQINESFISAASEAILTQLRSAGIELSSNEDKIREYKEDLYDLDERMPDLILAINSAVEIFDRGLDAMPRIQTRLPLVGSLISDSLHATESINKAVNSVSADTRSTQLLLARNFDLIVSVLAQSVDMGEFISTIVKDGHVFLQDLLSKSIISLNNIIEAITELENLINNDTSLSAADLASAQAVIDEMKQAASEYGAFLTNTSNAMSGGSINLEDTTTAVIDYNIKLLKQLEGLPAVLPDDIHTQAATIDDTISTFLLSIASNAAAGNVSGSISLLMRNIDSASLLLEGFSNVLGTINSVPGSSGTGLAPLSLSQLRQILEQIRHNLISISLNLGDKSKVADYIAELDRLLLGMKRQMESFRNDYNNVILPAIRRVSGDINLVHHDASSLGSLILNDIKLFQSILAEAEETGRHLDIYLKLLQGTLPQAQDDIHAVATKLRQIDELYDLDYIIDMMLSSSDEKKGFFAEPTELNVTRMFPIPNYGSASAPFYTVLALWVGTLLLSSMLKFEADEKFSPTQQFLGKYMLFLTVSQIQAIVITLGNLLIIRVYAADPVLFVFLGMFTSLIFSMIVFSLVSVFGNIGKAIGVILLVLQLSASGGTFPIEMTPGFFQMIHPYLPFTYAINAVREAVGGVIPELLWFNLRILLIFFVIAAIMGLLLKGPINKLSAGFVKKLKQSEIFEG